MHDDDDEDWMNAAVAPHAVRSCDRSDAAALSRHIIVIIIIRHSHLLHCLVTLARERLHGCTMNREVRMDALSSKDRLTKLEGIEKELSNAMASAGQAMAELAKDKPVLKNVESNSSAFLKSLTQVESDLSKQIQYLTQVSSGQAHEGSSYASQKVLTMAWHRIEHTKTRLSELDRMQEQHHQRH